MNAKEAQKIAAEKIGLSIPDLDMVLTLIRKHAEDGKFEMTHPFAEDMKLLKRLYDLGFDCHFNITNPSEPKLVVKWQSPREQDNP